MKSNRGSASSQKSYSRYDRSYSDNRRNNKNNDQINRNHFAASNQRALLNAIDYNNSVHMYQGNDFRPLSNNHPYGKPPHRQEIPSMVGHHIPSHYGSINMQDSFRNHPESVNFNRLSMSNFQGSPSNIYGNHMPQEQFGPLHKGNNPGHYGPGKMNNQAMNFAGSSVYNPPERFRNSPSTQNNRSDSFGKAASKYHGLCDNSHSQTNKMCEVFNDVLGEKPPESVISKSTNLSNTQQNTLNNSISPINSPTGSTGRNQTHRYKWRREERSTRSESQQGNADPTWEQGMNHDRYQRSKDRYKRPNQQNSEHRQEDKTNSTRYNEQSQRKSQTSEDSRKSRETSSSKETTSKKDYQASAEKSTRSANSDIDNAKSANNNESNITLTNKKNKINISNDNNNSSKSKEKDLRKEKISTTSEKKAISQTLKKKSSRAISSSSSSSGSDTDCMIDETNEGVSKGSKDQQDIIKLKSTAIIKSSSSATNRPSQPAIMGKSPTVLKDGSNDPKKKKFLKNKDSGLDKRINSAVATSATTSTSTSNQNSSIAANAACSSTEASQSNNNSVPSVKKPLSRADLLKLITPRSRKDQQRVELLMKEYSEKRDRAMAQGLLPTNSSSRNQSSSLDPSFCLEHLDLANLDFKVLKSDIPEELSEVINKVLDFDSTEKNPIILDDDEEANGNTGKFKNLSDKLQRKRKNSEPPGNGKRFRERTPSVNNKTIAEEPSTDPSGTHDDSTSNDQINNKKPEIAEVQTEDSTIPSVSPATPSPGPSSSSSLPSGILETLLQLSLKEDEIQGHISNLDMEIQSIQAMIVDLSHKLNSKKHHRDMMINEEKRLKTFRIQALRASVISNNMSPELHQQLLSCVASSRAVDAFPHEGENMNFQMNNQVVMPTDDKVINIVPQFETNEDEVESERDETVSEISVPSGRNADVPLHEPQQIRPILSPQSRLLENTTVGHVRYLGTLNDISHLFRRPSSANSDLSKGTEPCPIVPPAVDIPTATNENARNTSCKVEIETSPVPETEANISQIKSELAAQN